jgi:LysM repeat protein
MLTSPATPLAVIGTIALTVSAAPSAAHAEAPAQAATPAASAAPPVAPITAVATKKRPATHTVVRGDTVSAIAAAHGLRTADVLAWNDLGWKSIIHPGDVLRLSASADASKSNGKTQRAGARASARDASHAVSAGDTLWAIARSHGISLRTLLKANGLTPATIIYPGQKLTIPGASSTAQRAEKASPAPAAASSRTSQKTADLDAEQIANAKAIIAVGRERGVPERGIAIALATAMVESWLRNLDYGTYDSLGLFQQRPSTGWGTEDQVRDPRRSAAAFFGGPRDPNGTDTRGLLDLPGWRDMGFGEAAQAVQLSAHPDRYGMWRDQAYAWLDELG